MSWGYFGHLILEEVHKAISYEFLSFICGPINYVELGHVVSLHATPEQLAHHNL